MRRVLCLVNEIDSIWFSRATAARESFSCFIGHEWRMRLARSYARFALSYFTRPWLRFTVEPRRREYKKQKSQNEISTRPSELYKGFIVRHTRAPLHCMRIGAETVLRDKKLSPWLEKATAGNFKYRLRVLSFAKCLFKTSTACDRALRDIFNSDLCHRLCENTLFLRGISKPI